MGDPRSQALVTVKASNTLPVLVADATDGVRRRFLEYFTAQIRNPNTREAYARAIARFLGWADQMGLTLETIEPMAVGLYIEELMTELKAPSVKQHLAAIRAVFDYLVAGGALPSNPAKSVRGPKHTQRVGRTPVLDADQARELLDSIPLTDRRGNRLVVGYRDRALIGVMVFTFSRVSATIKMDVEDFYQDGKKWMVRLHEKGGKEHVVPAHHNAILYLAEYLEVAGITKGPMFRSADRRKQLTETRLHRGAVLRMVKRRAKAAGLPPTVCCHTFRATGITTYLQNEGTLENAQRFAAHASPTTTQLYDRTGDELSLDEIERVRI